MTFVQRKRCCPCRMTVLVPSGIFSIFKMRATVPTLLRSSGPGTSVSSSFWLTTPIRDSDLLASRIKRTLRSRPTLMGMTTPGKSTVLRKDSKGSTSGTSFSCMACSSSSVRMGMKSWSWMSLKRMAFFICLFTGQSACQSTTNAKPAKIKRQPVQFLVQVIPYRQGVRQVVRFTPRRRARRRLSESATPLPESLQHRVWP